MFSATGKEVSLSEDDNNAVLLEMKVNILQIYEVFHAKEFNIKTIQ